ncbi:hypothetical protein Q604_UNBC08160G0001, partial [human gut metagenome]
TAREIHDGSLNLKLLKFHPLIVVFAIRIAVDSCG